MGQSGCQKVRPHWPPVLTLDAENPSLTEVGLPLKVKLPMKAEEVPENTVVLYTHVDKDHLGPETAKTLAKKGIRMIGTLAVFEKLARLGVPVDQIEVLRNYEKTTAGEVLVESTAADHPWQLKDLKRGGRPYRLGECCGYILEVPEGRLFFPGDHGACRRTRRSLSLHHGIRDPRLRRLPGRAILLHGIYEKERQGRKMT